MGNIFSIQCGDALAGRCWDCVSMKSQYISQLEDNLISLEAARDRLLEKRNDLRRTVVNQQRPEMEQPDQVAGWFSRVDHTVTEATELLTRGAQERQNLCVAGYCSSNCISTYKFGKSVAQSLVRVNALMNEADFNQVVVNAPARQLESDLRDLRNAKVDLEAKKEDLQQRISSEEGPGMRTLKEVREWLSKAETVLAEADPLIEDGPQELRKLLSGDNSNSVFVGRVAQHIDHIRSLHSQGDFSQVTAKAVPRRVVGRNQRPTVGNEEMLEEAWSLLRRVEVGIIGIYGMGGVGKTTLLTQINNKFASAPGGFDVVIWVVVSKDLKLEKMQESIWKQIQSLDGHWLQKSFEEKAQDIFDVMRRRKKFVLLLDDVWQQFDLEEMGVPLPTQQNGCKVVLTTRSFAVCKKMEATKTMKVKPLNQEEAWQLFTEKVGNVNADVLHLAQKIAQECRGLPIALITIGRAMASRGTIEEWEHALKVLRRSVSNLQGVEDELYQDMEVHVFKRLKFSYDCLPNDNLRSCFVYCSLFPEDFRIPKVDLVHYWNSEKFCSLSEGYGIVYTLIRQCLVEEIGDYVKMHDVVRDMAVWITCECEKEHYKFFTQSGSQLVEIPDAKEWEGAKKVSFMGNYFTSIEGSPRCCDLETLFLSHNRNLIIILQGFFQFMTKLTVLDLSGSGLGVLPLEIMNLHMLEHLNLSRSPLKALPTEMKNLMRLKYLNFEVTLVNMIPVEVISSLSKLQVLNICQIGPGYNEEVENNVLSNDGNNLMKELMCLKNLSELSLDVRSASFLHSICSNQHLLNSIRTLQLLSISDLKTFNMLSLANAKQLCSLDLQEIGWEEVVIEDMETHAHGPGICLNNNRFSHIHKVLVSECAMRHMTWLIFAPNLTILAAWYNENMEEVISADKLSEYQGRGERLKLFPKLRLLQLGFLPKLKTICPESLPFPCLTKLIVKECPALKKLPLNSESAEGCDVVIKGQESWWNELTWEDDETRAAFSSSFQSGFF